MKRTTFTWAWIGVAISLLLRITNTTCSIMLCRYLSTRTILFPSTTCYGTSGPLIPILPYTIHCIMKIEPHHNRGYHTHTLFPHCSPSSLWHLLHMAVLHAVPPPSLVSVVWYHPHRSNCRLPRDPMASSSSPLLETKVTTHNLHTQVAVVGVVVSITTPY